MQILVFEDRRVDRLFPSACARPAYALTCAGETLGEWLDRLNSRSVVALVRPHLQSVAAAARPAWQVSSGSAALEGAEPTLFVNARLVPSAGSFRRLSRIVAEGRDCVHWSGEDVACGYAVATKPPSPIEAARIGDFFRLAGVEAAGQPQAAVAGSPGEADPWPMLEYPHDIVRHNLSSFSENVEARIARGSYQQLRDGLFVAENVKLGEYLTVDCSTGPIVIESGASVGPYCFLRGPAVIGAGARIIEHSAIKDSVSLGHTTKVGGEVEASVIEPFTNKQHYGFLGHSYLGSWINLGAGTCNSDLKNTYGEVKMEYRGKKVSTGMQFIGCIIGDYSKSAINTGIFTGKSIGVCSMLYGFVTTNVPSFVNYARLFGQVTELPVEVMVSTQKRMFARRNVEQRDHDIRLLHDMYDLTRDERTLAGEPLSL
ncbi:MAG TPA: putative sugar nucleotidyl transferase [Pirellulaceae bacterium]|jgi:glucose-1-phosphate thymidylyltransferase|nr:putative sugar nucleotidyl transferase [Pirellulaceae bacterium]